MQDDSDPPDLLNGRSDDGHGPVLQSEDGSQTSGGGSGLSSRVESALGDILDALDDRMRAVFSAADTDSDTDAGEAATPHTHASELLEVDPELLDARRRIVQILVESGGTVPQADLVERTRWTSSTISRKLGEMEADGVVTRHTVGTGKVAVLNDDFE